MTGQEHILDYLRQHPGPQRIGATQLQQGFMAVIRGITWRLVDETTGRVVARCDVGGWTEVERG